MNKMFIPVLTITLVIMSISLSHAGLYGKSRVIGEISMIDYSNGIRFTFIDGSELINGASYPGAPCSNLTHGWIDKSNPNFDHLYGLLLTSRVKDMTMRVTVVDGQCGANGKDVLVDGLILE